MVKTVSEGTWLVEETTSLTQLIIAEGASLAAPEGKGLTLTVDGISREIKPGYYTGDVVITVADFYVMPPAGLFANLGIYTDMRTAICVEDGKLSTEKCVPAIVRGGTFTDTGADDILIEGTDEAFNGILVTGDSAYTVNNAKIHLDGDGGNDFIGFGAAILAMGKSQLTINDSEVILHGVTRCTLHIGGESVVTVNNSTLINDSGTTTKMRAAWVLGLDGTNRNSQLTDSGTVVYNNCYLKGNGWGVQSIDGGDNCHMTFKDCKIELSGPRARGYGIFAIGDCKAIFDHCEFDVYGYPVLMNTENHSYVEVGNGSVIKGGMHAAMIFRDAEGVLKISDSTVATGRACFLVKGSATTINISNSAVSAANGIILQVIDNDDPGMMRNGFVPPHGEVDVADPDRDLAASDVKYDVIMTMDNMDITGDFLNSSTNIRANCRDVEGDGPNGHTGVLEGISVDELAEKTPEMIAQEEYIEVLQGAHNIDLTFTNTKITGRLSSATQAYRADVTFIDAKNFEELSNVTQTVAPTVNNGVIVKLCAGSVWTVPDTCYLTKLVIDDTSSVVAPAGKTLTATVDGAPVALTGTITGKIAITVA